MFLHTPVICTSRADNGCSSLSENLSISSLLSATSASSGADHLAVITAFVDAYGERLPREYLWDLLKAAMGSEQSAAWTGEQRADYMQFCERLSALVDACYLLIR
jgi:hypothetical protein